MGVIVKFPNINNKFRLIVLTVKGEVLEDDFLNMEQIKTRLNELHYHQTDSGIFHIKIVKDNHIILNRVFIPFESNEKNIIAKIASM